MVTQRKTISPHEYVIITDEDNRRLGVVLRREMRRQRLIHRATYILVFNSVGKIFVLKRTMTKDIYPGYFEIAAGGVVRADESYDESARRELAEELGIRGVRPLHLFDHYYEDAENRVWGRIYSCRHNGPMTLQAEEVEYGRFMTVSEIFRLHDKDPFTPDSMEILDRLLTETPELVTPA